MGRGRGTGILKEKQDQRSTAPTWYQLGPFQSHLGPPFGSHLEHFGSNLGPYEKSFGTIWETPGAIW